MKRLLLAAATILCAAAASEHASAVVPARPENFPLSADEKAKILAAAEAGDTYAQYQMGEINDFWPGETPNYVEAIRWYEKAAHGNYPDDRVQQLKAFIAEHAHLYAEAQTGDAAKLYAFAIHTPHRATGLAGDDSKPHWLFQAAKAGSADAQAEVGELYFRAYYLRRSGQQSYGVETEEMGPPEDVTNPGFWDIPNFKGEADDTDIGNAILWLSKAAGAPGDKGWRAYDLGIAYLVQGPTFDPVKGRFWLGKALTLGPDIPASACQLDFTGSLELLPLADFSRLISVRQAPDYNAAMRCYRSTQPQRREAVWFMGYMYHRGLGTVRNDERAIQLLTDAQKTDYAPEALYELSLLYRDSPSIPHDRVKAYILVSEAINRIAYAPHSSCPGRDIYAEKAGETPAMREDQYHLYLTLSATQKAAADGYLNAEGIWSHSALPPPYPPITMPCV